MNLEILNRCGENTLQIMWPMLWQSSVLVSILFALDFVFRKKVRAAIRYALWLVVLVKLILPTTIASPTNPRWWIHFSTPPTAKTKTIPFTVTYGDQIAPDFQMPLTPIPVLPRPHLSFAACILIFSIGASLSLFAWLLIRWRRVSQKVRDAKISGELDSLLDEVRQLAGLRSAIRLRLTTDSMSPAVCGLFRPVILLPQLLVTNLSCEQLRVVLLHEAIHLRRGDVWVNCAQALLQIIYWWHPLLWLANARIRRVREEAVDDAVMLALRDESEIYAPTLLEVAKFAFRRPLATLGLVGILESRSALRQRIERLVDFRAPRKAGLTVISLFGILIFSAVALPMGEAPEKMNEIVSQTNNFSAETKNKMESIKLAWDGKFFYEAGRFKRAESELNIALKLDPENNAAIYYLGLVKKAMSSPQTSKTNPTMNWLNDLTHSNLLVADSASTDLEMRTFKLDEFSIAALRTTPDIKSNNISTMAKDFFGKFGVDLSVPGKQIAFNDNWGLLFVRATATDLDTIERSIEALNKIGPQVHIKARFIEVPKKFIVPESFLNVAVNPMIGILSNTNFRTILHILQQQKNAETIAEPEVITTSGRKTYMRATIMQEVLTNFAFEEISNTSAIEAQTGKFEIGPTMDVVPYVLADGYTINLTAKPELFQFLGYDQTTNVVFATNSLGEKIQRPIASPCFRVQESKAVVNLWDNQTLVLGNFRNSGESHFVGFTNGVETTDETKSFAELERKSSTANKELLVFVTATIVDPAGNRIHSDNELSKLSAIPSQPQN